jgi:hypothetical protein
MPVLGLAAQRAYFTIPKDGDGVRFRVLPSLRIASAPPFLLWPPLQNARSLPDRCPDPRPVLDGVGKDFLRLSKIIAGIKQGIDSHAVPRKLLDLVEVADVRNQRSLVSSSDQSLIGVLAGTTTALG